MLQQFHHLYPQGSLVSELIDIDRGLYIVKVSVHNADIILGTGMATGDTIEKAEDRARERALMTVNLGSAKSSGSSLQNSLQPVTPPPVAPPPVPEKPPFVAETPIPQASPAPIATEPQNVNTHPEVADFEVSSPIETPVAVAETQTNIFDQPISSPAPVAETPVAVAEPETYIFDQPISSPAPEVETPTVMEFDFNEIKHKIDLEMKRLNWTKEEGRDYLLSTYGKRSRLHLKDDELYEFWQYLESLPG